MLWAATELEGTFDEIKVNVYAIIEQLVAAGLSQPHQDLPEQSACPGLLLKPRLQIRRMDDPALHQHLTQSRSPLRHVVGLSKKRAGPARHRITPRSTVSRSPSP